MDTYLVATDLDDTLVGDDKALDVANQLLTELRTRQKIKLVYVTGRSPELYTELQQRKSLVQPDALVMAAGTEIYVAGQGLAGWPTATDWQPESVKTALAGVKELELQPTTEQRQFKISYFLKQDDDLLRQVRDRLAAQPVDVIYSGERFLDILPRGVHKGSALLFLANTWGVPKNRIIACGDSADDIEMLRVDKAIVVGNAADELVYWLTTVDQNYAYMAHDRYAKGIIEGLRFFKITD